VFEDIFAEFVLELLAVPLVFVRALGIQLERHNHADAKLVRQV
jgi:hypothetical protein